MACQNWISVGAACAAALRASASRTRIGRNSKPPDKMAPQYSPWHKRSLSAAARRPVGAMIGAMSESQIPGAAELCAAYAAKRVSPVEVTRAALDRMARWEPKLNAMYLIHGDEALAQARASEARWRSGTPLSGLDGVPVTIKENITTKG